MTKQGGLAGIVVGKTALSDIDGQEGRLTYRGYPIQQLAQASTFEEVAYLLWHGHLPNAEELHNLKRQFAEEYAIPQDLIPLLKLLAARAPPMEALRTGVSALAMFDPDVRHNEPQANLRKSLRLTAKIPTLVAAYNRFREGNDPIQPRQDLNIATNFLYMLKGRVPDDEIARDFDVALILHADHGFNASTFSARVTASTLSDLHSAITSAVGTLKGPLHGGANEAVMRMLEEIGSVNRAREYVRVKLGERAKIPGFGHRVYKTLDPRAVPLSEISERLGKRSGNLKWYEMSTQIQRIVKEEKGLDPNVDFYSASAYHSMGIPTDLFTPIFAMSRVTGWTAHVMEQLSDNRLIRPDAEYVGPEHQEYVPVEGRG